MWYYLAEVEAFVDPAVVVPDIGGPNNAYFWIKSREKLAKLFKQWLIAPIELINPQEYEGNLPLEMPANGNESDDESSVTVEDSTNAGEDGSVSDSS